MADSDDNSNDDVMLQQTDRYKVIIIKDVFGQMNDQIKAISDVMNIPTASARIILEHYNWQSESLMEKFVLADSANKQDAFFRDARILNPKYVNCTGRYKVVAECSICFDTGEAIRLHCGHKFCRNCWNQYLTTKIVEYGEQRIPCPDPECVIIVEYEIVKRYISDPNVLQKFNRSICNNYVQFRENLKWCTSPGCNCVIHLYDCTIKFVTCECGNSFCVECHEQAHSPISCHHLQQWKDDDYVTKSYLSVYTKPCPKCRMAIEKNGGCPHMTCVSCKHEFCWKCLAPWIRHLNLMCNNRVYDFGSRETRSPLQRLTYCWDRYAYNRDAWKDEIERFEIPWEQFEHRMPLKASLSYIFECRRFLMYSYAFIYYLKENNDVYILESNLDVVEASVDAVSVLLENYIRLKDSNDDFEQREEPLRCDIVDKASSCDTLRKKWLDKTEEGQANNTFVYREEDPSQ